LHFDSFNTSYSHLATASAFFFL